MGEVQILIFCTSGLVKEEGLFGNIKYFTIGTIWLADVALFNNANKSYRIQLDCKWNKILNLIMPDTLSYEMTKNN